MTSMEFPIKLPGSLIVILICGIFYVGFFFTEDLKVLTSTLVLEQKPADIVESSNVTKAELNLEEKILPPFERKKCNVENGKWVFDRSIEPLYSDTSCSYLDLQVSCVKNGRPDDDYKYWHWKLNDCDLPRFDAADVLEKLRGKRLMFVGDSLQRGQWQSFVCLVESHLDPDQKSLKRGSYLSVFKAKKYNATIEFYWAPFLIESNSDVPVLVDSSLRILRVDSITKHAQNWIGADILVFNTYVWWMTGQKIKSLWGSFENGEEGFEELDADIAYRVSLKTWANWIDSNINPNKTRVFFTTKSPTHLRSVVWGHKGIRCYNETKPIKDGEYKGIGTDKKILEAVRSVIGRMKVPVSFLNITHLSEYRVDGHASVYTESQGKVLTEEQKSDPQRYADCIHWCLPGLPDTWNQLFYANL